VTRPICVKGANDIFELLVRDHAADKHDVGPVIVEFSESAIGRGIEAALVGFDSARPLAL